MVSRASPTVGSRSHLLVDTGFVVEDFIEIQIADRGDEVRSTTTAGWAHHWPSELVWIARKPEHPQRTERGLSGDELSTVEP